MSSKTGHVPTSPDPKQPRPRLEEATRPPRIDMPDRDPGLGDPDPLPTVPDYLPGSPKNPMPHVWPVEPETK
jgi:hypothetical protein